jgi:hypothetical protein
MLTAIEGSALQNDPRNSLQELIQRKAQSLSAEAVASDGCMSGEQSEQLEYLHMLLELTNRSTPTRRRPVWPIALVFVTTVMLVSLLAFGRMPRTEILLDVQAEEVAFGVASSQMFLEAIALSTLGISGDTVIDMPGPSGNFQRLERVPVHLTVASLGEARGSVDLSPLALGAGTRVSMLYAGAPGRFRLAHQGEEAEHRVNLSGPIDLAGPAPEGHRLDFQIPRPVRIRCGKQAVTLDLGLHGDSDGKEVIAGLHISELDFIRVDQRATHRGTAIRRRSAIRSGTLFMESLNGRAMQLRPGQVLRFQRVEGEIRTAGLTKDAIALQFHGSVAGMTTGALDDPSSLMPTWLEWLAERRTLYLFWGTAMYLLGLAIVIMRWLRMEV